MRNEDAWRGPLAELERASTARGRTRLGAYRIEGTRLVERALRAGVRVDRVLVGSGFVRSAGPRVRALLDAMAESGARTITAPDAALAQLAEGREEGAIAALVPLPDEPAWAELERTGGSAGTTILVAAGIDDPGNVGALARTALASGCTALVVAGGSDPFHPRAVRVSRGALFKLPLLRREGIVEALEELRRVGHRLVGAVVDGGVTLGGALPADGRLALVMGNEASGLDPAVVRRLDLRVTVPMSDEVDSFSVNAAAAIVLWERRRSR